MLSQGSRFLALAKRSAASGDENVVIVKVFRYSFFLDQLAFYQPFLILIDAEITPVFV